MNRFFLTAQEISKREMVSFPPEISHQILHVLRMKTGDRVEVLDNSGRGYLVELALSDFQEVQGQVIEAYRVETEPGLFLSLCFGLTSRDKVEWILQKATEIGVSEFRPFVSSRTLVQSTDLGKKKQDRWERIIREAAEQSGRGRLPVLHPPCEYDHLLDVLADSFPRCLLAWEDADVDALGLQDLPPVERIALLIGPEGGFEPGEARAARRSGCQIVSLGKRILRMETAAMVFPALILHGYGEL
jgi:16S rRNA (uracil1498-N3)-methyltransferase